MLERAARELAPFLDEVAFVGGATIALWFTEPGVAAEALQLGAAGADGRSAGFEPSA